MYLSAYMFFIDWVQKAELFFMFGFMFGSGRKPQFSGSRLSLMHRNIGLKLQIWSQVKEVFEILGYRGKTNLKSMQHSRNTLFMWGMVA